MIAIINKKETGKKIKQARIKRDYKVEYVVEELKLQNYLSFEEGLTIPTINQLLDLSKLFDVKMDELISYKVEN